MSSQNRKISYYSIEFANGDDCFFDVAIFNDFFEYISQLSEADRIFNDTRKAKAQELYSVDNKITQGKSLLKVVFKSCKYNHSPDLMSSIDGSERASDKKSFEGEKELTHMCMEITPTEAFTIFEDRRNGVTISQVITYLNSWLRKYIQEKELENNFYFIYSIVPSEDFLASLQSVNRITLAELFTEKELLGSEHFNLMELDDNSQDDIIMQIKAKRKHSLTKDSVQQAFNRIVSTESRLKRIRIRAKDNQNMNVILDSISAKKKQEITVNLMENGTVDSYSIFSKMEEILGVTE